MNNRDLLSMMTAIFGPPQEGSEGVTVFVSQPSPPSDPRTSNAFVVVAGNILDWTKDMGVTTLASSCAVDYHRRHGDETHHPVTVEDVQNSIDMPERIHREVNQIAENVLERHTNHLTGIIKHPISNAMIPLELVRDLCTYLADLATQEIEQHAASTPIPSPTFSPSDPPCPACYGRVHQGTGRRRS